MWDADSPQLAEGSKEGQRRDAGKRGAAEKVGLRGSGALTERLSHSSSGWRKALGAAPWCPLELRLGEGAGSSTLMPPPHTPCCPRPFGRTPTGIRGHLPEQGRVAGVGKQKTNLTSVSFYASRLVPHVQKTESFLSFSGCVPKPSR